MRALLALAAVAAGDTRPNLVFIMADDQGWHNSGFHNDDLLTPHTNQLVAEGVRLTNHYVYKFCSPSRSSFLSGRLAIHVNQENSATEQPGAGVPLNMTMLPTKLAAAGYACHHVGKWHAGQATFGHIPAGRGFESSLGFFNFGEDHYTQIRGGAALASARGRGRRRRGRLLGRRPLARRRARAARTAVRRVRLHRAGRRRDRAPRQRVGRCAALPVRRVPKPARPAAGPRRVHRALRGRAAAHDRQRHDELPRRGGRQPDGRAARARAVRERADRVLARQRRLPR